MVQSTFDREVDGQTTDEIGGKGLSDFIVRLGTLRDLLCEIKRVAGAKACIIRPFSQIFEDVLTQSEIYEDMGCQCSEVPQKTCLCRRILETAEPLSILRLRRDGGVACRLLGDCGSYVSMPLPPLYGKTIGVLSLGDADGSEADYGAALRTFGGLAAESARISSAFQDYSARRRRMLGELGNRIACALLSSKTGDYLKVLELLGSALGVDGCQMVTKGPQGSGGRETSEWRAGGAWSAAGDIYLSLSNREFDAVAAEEFCTPDMGDMSERQITIGDKLRADGVGSALCAPIRYGGETLGILGLYTAKGNPIWDAEAKGLVRNVCEMLGICVNRKRTDATARRWKTVDTLLKDLDRKILNNHSVDELLRGFCDELSGTLDYPAILVLLYENEDTAQTAVSNAAIASVLQDNLAKLDTPSFRAWSMGEDLKGGRPKVVGRDGSDRGYGQWNSFVDGLGVKSVAAIPLMVEGNSIGVLIIGARTVDEFEDEANIGILSGFAAQLSISLTSARHQQQIRYLATHDSLTNLYNRHSFEESLSIFHKETLGKSRGAVLLLDLDNFKIVNDTFGHQVGDILLQKFGDFLKDQVGDSGVVARLGGDEFGILYEYEDYEYIRSVVKDLTDNIEKFTFSCEGIKCNLTASMGLMPIDGSLHVGGLLAMVDSALYEAKDRGKNQLVSLGEVHSRDSVGFKSIESSRLALEIQEAIADRRFVLHFQPVVQSSGGIVEHYEALIRMVGKNGELIMPEDFIPVAEHFDMMRRVDRWSLETVIKILENKRDISIFVNMSSASLKDEDLLKLVEASITGGRLRGSQITFEIKESAAVNDLQGVQKWMARLKELGCSFCLDDFGLGFSSLSYLHKLPVDYVKIDGSFVKRLDVEPESRAIVKSITSVSLALGKRVIAGHVESGSVNDVIQELGIKYSQGFYWKRPGPIDWHMS